MSALARYFKNSGLNVSGYDKTETKLTSQLINEGIDIHFEDNIDLLPKGITIENSLIIYTPAVPSKMGEFVYFKENNFDLKKRAEVLGFIANQKTGLAIAGTHGKTTVTTLLSHILDHSTKKCNAFLGGISKNINSNYIYSKDSEYVVVEADEFDRSFLNLYPQYAVITSVDADHLDVYSTKTEIKKAFTQFTKQIRKGGFLIKNSKVKLDTEVENTFTYSLESKDSTFYAKNIRLNNYLYTFDFVAQKTVIKDLTLGISGLINVENAIASLSIAYLIGVTENEMRESLNSFTGINRRFDFKIEKKNLIYIDDYAHHPEEINAVLKSAKELFPTKKITAIFQPHLYTRTRDFAEEFAKNLDIADDIILLDIYPAREEKIEGVTSKIIYDKIKNENKQLCTKDEVLKILSSKDLEVLITMGAGNIDKLVDPIVDLIY